MSLADPDDKTKSSAMADELTFWVRDNLPSWGDNDPYYALWTKTKKMFAEMLDERKSNSAA